MKGPVYVLLGPSVCSNDLARFIKYELCQSLIGVISAELQCCFVIVCDRQRAVDRNWQSKLAIGFANDSVFSCLFIFLLLF